MTYNKLKIFLLISCPSLWPFVNFVNANIGEYYSYTKLLLITFGSLFLIWGLLFITKPIIFKKNSVLETAIIFSTSIIIFFSFTLSQKISILLFNNTHHLKIWILMFAITFSISCIFCSKKWF